MPVNTTLSNEVWARYQWLRDNGHSDYIKKAKQCEDFFVGLQWDANDLALLKAARRPALTINKIISTVSNVMGEQIFNRTDVAFKPRNSGATEDVAHALSKVFMQISDNNQLPWVRSDVFADGIIGSRGFFDVRLDFSDSLRGEVKIEQLNPKNVMIDADSDEYDPDKWGDVITTKWMSVDQIEILYGKKEADLLRGRMDSYTPYGYDEADTGRDRFGDSTANVYTSESLEATSNMRMVRVLERQHKRLDKMQHFVDLQTGDLRQVPSEWDEDQIQQFLATNPQLGMTKKLIQRIRWTVVADDIVLHDEWSPYKHFTVVPYFPHFRRGVTVGLVENLLGPQELLNKVSSQELHVVNTTANSGWKVKRNSLQNMTVGELEQRGAETGLVIELDELNSAEKISPNQTPSGLDRISYKAEEHLKTISGVSDYMAGFAREDVSAKSVNANKQSGQANLAKVMDNMNRTDTLLARNVLDVVQAYYTEARLLYITTDKLTNTTEQVEVNQQTPEGTIMNDLTLGEYAVVITNQPDRDTYEDSQYEQALRLRTEAGVQIPDSYIIKASKLKDKAEIIGAIEGDKDSPEAQAAAALKQRTDEATVANLEAEVSKKQTDTQLAGVRAQKEMVQIQLDTQELQNGGAEGGEQAKMMAEQQLEMQKAEMDNQLARDKMDGEFALRREQMEREFQLKTEQMEREMELKREIANQDAEIKRKQAADEAMNQRVETAKQAQTESASKKPTPEKK